jgi:ribulose-5-phosphate 4-epimerase/fuculose-1-phosphate aldolase
MTEGYIKFHCNWEQKEIRIQEEIFQNLEQERSQLFKLGLIGMYPDGIGFGNISVKSEENTSFIITGSATGQYAHLDHSHFALVTAYNFEKNSVTCEGMTRASAESLTHAAVYEALPEMGAVVHVHCLWLWEKLLNNYPTTSEEIEYGTPEMAYAVKNLAATLNPKQEKVIVMGGHREGILAFGRNLKEATSTIINLFNQNKND